MVIKGVEKGVDLRYKFELKKGYKNIGIVYSTYKDEPNRSYRGTISFCGIEYEKKIKLCVVTAAHNLYKENAITGK